MTNPILPKPKEIRLDYTGIWKFTQGELDMLGLKPGDPFGRGIVGPPITRPSQPTTQMTPDQVRRLRECAFDEDITQAVRLSGFYDDSYAEAMAECLTDIRSILDESTDA